MRLSRLGTDVAAARSPRFSGPCPSWADRSSRWVSRAAAGPPNRSGFRLVAEAGYTGERILVIDPADIAQLHTEALVTEQLFKKLGFNVELAYPCASPPTAPPTERRTPAEKPRLLDVGRRIPRE